MGLSRRNTQVNKFSTMSPLVGILSKNGGELAATINCEEDYNLELRQNPMRSEELCLTILCLKTLLFGLSSYSGNVKPSLINYIAPRGSPIFWLML